MSLILNGISIISRKSDNFINATQLCKAGGKVFKEWYKLKSTKLLIKILQESLIDKKVVDIMVGGNHSGSWIYPNLAVQLAQWISPIFAMRVSEWINEWRTFSHKNEEKFIKALCEIQPS